MVSKLRTLKTNFHYRTHPTLIILFFFFILLMTEVSINKHIHRLQIRLQMFRLRFESLITQYSLIVVSFQTFRNWLMLIVGEMTVCISDSPSFQFSNLIIYIIC